MKSILFFVASLLAGLTSTAPTGDDKRIIITKEFFPNELVKYTAHHDIVSIVLPINALNFPENDEDDDSDSYVFFVEADTKDNGEMVYQGLYVLKNDNATKLLENGRDITTTYDETKTVYFAASDGLYTYNVQKNKAEKYGTITDSIISIAKVNGSDIIYILSEDHILYKVSEEGTKKEKIDKVVDAKQIVLDYENNLYFYTVDKQVYVFTTEGVKKIEGLPTASYINILKPPLFLEDGVPVVIDNKAYIAYSNGTSELTNFEFVAKPTAYSTESIIILYFGYNKKIYVYNLLDLVLADTVSDIKELLNDKKESIETLSTYKTSQLRSPSAPKF